MKFFWEIDVRKIPLMQKGNHSNVVDMFSRNTLRIAKRKSFKVKHVLKGPA